MKFRKQGIVGPYEIELLQRDGSKISCMNNATPIYDQTGLKIGSIGLWTDIAEIKNALSELEAAKLLAETANRSKSEFLSSMSHELRTPLNAILGFGQLLGSNPNEPLSKTQMDYSLQILKGGDHLLELIDQVLELSKIESGNICVSIENVAPLAVIKESLKMIETQAHQKSIELSFFSDETLPKLWSDRSRFRQILLNLLSNAVKYNREGGSVAVTTTTLENNFLRISVTDTGFGIPAEKQDAIFEPFNRLGKEAGEIEGTGIGLTITKQLIELMGGHIDFSSEEHVGSSFWIDLPVSDRDSADVDGFDTKNMKSAVEDANGKSGLVLYIEDNPANLNLMEAIIERIPKVSMKSAHNAELGLTIARDIQPNLILLDINLPGMDGYEALLRLREYQETKSIPVIAVSAAAMPEDISRAKAAGFEDYITKPINVSEVLAVISSHIL